MKKNVIYVLLLSVVALCSCGHNKTENVAQQRDSLMNEDNRMNEFLDIVSVSMDSINGKESCLFLSKEGKPLSNKEQIRDNIKLFKYTELQSNININNVTLVEKGGQPRLLNIKDLLMDI